MAAHTDVAGYAGVTYAVSATLPASYDAAGYGATTITYTTIGKVESFPEFGVSQPVAEFPGINGVEYTKGQTRFGSGAMVMGDVPADAGQVILKAASTTRAHYSLKLTYPDGEIHYLDVQVASWMLSQQTENGQMKRTAQLQLCRAPVVVAAA